MGVKGLWGLANATSDERLLLEDGTILVVDAVGFVMWLAGEVSPDPMVPTHAAAVMRALDAFVDRLAAHGVGLEFVFDGMHAAEKEGTHMQRLKARLAAVRALQKGDTVTDGLPRSLVLTSAVKAHLVARAGVAVVQASYEADRAIARRCGILTAAGAPCGVVSNDSDFLCFEVPFMVPPWRLELAGDGRPSARVLRRDAVAKTLRIHPQAMTTLACLAGNDRIDPPGWLPSSLMLASNTRPPKKKAKKHPGGVSPGYVLQVGSHVLADTFDASRPLVDNDVALLRALFPSLAGGAKRPKSGTSRRKKRGSGRKSPVVATPSSSPPTIKCIAAGVHAGEPFGDTLHPAATSCIKFLTALHSVRAWYDVSACPEAGGSGGDAWVVLCGPADGAGAGSAAAPLADFAWPPPFEPSIPAAEAADAEPSAAPPPVLPLTPGLLTLPLPLAELFTGGRLWWDAVLEPAGADELTFAVLGPFRRGLLAAVAMALGAPPGTMTFQEVAVRGGKPRVVDVAVPSSGSAREAPLELLHTTAGFHSSATLSFVHLACGLALRLAVVHRRAVRHVLAACLTALKPHTSDDVLPPPGKSAPGGLPVAAASAFLEATYVHVEWLNAALRSPLTPPTCPPLGNPAAPLVSARLEHCTAVEEDALAPGVTWQAWLAALEPGAVAAAAAGDAAAWRADIEAWLQGLRTAAVPP